MDINDINLKNKPKYESFFRLIEEHCYCPICIKIAENAVESECCGNIFCLLCTKKLNNCPICRKENLKTHQSLMMRKIIKSIPIKCIYDCGYINTIDLMDQHYLLCQNRLFNCKIQNCNKYFKKDDFIKHISKDHENFIITIAEKYEDFISYQQQLKKTNSNGHLIKMNFNTAEDIVYNQMHINNGKVSYVDEIIDIE